MDYEAAAAYWEARDAQAVKMEPDTLLAEMEAFLAAHNTCALATGCGAFVRCTPVEYSYLDGKIWVLTEGGLKFLALKHNPGVCLAVFDPFSGFETLNGMQIYGTVEIAEPWSEEYLRLLAWRKLPAEDLKKLPQPLYLLRITPLRMDYLCAEFQKRGFAPRQHLTFGSPEIR